MESIMKYILLGTGTALTTVIAIRMVGLLDGAGLAHTIGTILWVWVGMISIHTIINSLVKYFKNG